MQKREETALSLAVTSPKAKIIDKAYLTGPVSPNPGLFYLVALIAGVLIPFGVLYIYKMLDTKLKTRRDIEEATAIPFLGDLPKFDKPNTIIDSKDRSSSAEALRMIRTNLEFILGNLPSNKSKTIFVTSSIQKEGKTFFALNLIFS